MGPIVSGPAGKAVTIVFLSALVLLVDYLGLFNGINNYCYDLLFRLRGPVAPESRVIIVAVDDGTLEKLGRWPIRRAHYGYLLTWLKEADAVAFDIIMAEPSADDGMLKEAIQRHGKVILPVIIGDRMAPVYPVTGAAGGRVGHIYLEPGIDGVVREVFHTLLYRGSAFRSFSSVTFETVTGKRLDRTWEGKLPGPTAGIVQMDRMYINFCGPPGSFERVSLSHVLEGVYPPSFFKGRICLVGITATGAGETLLTPFSQDRKGTPGVEVHANALNTLLRGDAIRTAPRWTGWLSGMILALLSFLLFLRISEARAVVSASLILICLGVATFVLFSAFSLRLAPSVHFFAVLLAFAASYVFKFREAAGRLDEAYLAVAGSLRRSPDSAGPRSSRPGMRGLLTPGGVSARVRVLGAVTDRLLFEKELTDAAVFSDAQGVLLFGPDGTIIIANGVAVALCKGNGVDFGTVDAFMNGVAAFVEGGAGTEALSGSIGGPDRHEAFNVAFPSPQKKFFTLNASSLAIQGEGYPLFVLFDITAVKELEILKGHVVSLVSHEIKTPLASIEGFSDLLEESLEGELKGYAAIVREESARLIRFLTAFLDITRMEEGRQPVKKEPVMLPEVAEEAVRTLLALAEKKGVTVRAVKSGEVSPVMADRDLVTQCLVNLLENGIKYSSPDKTVIIRVAEEADRVRADVIDEGAGIREGEKERIFEKFYRGEPDGTGDVRGSGLGLAFVREAMGAQGGTVSVESRYGEGSAFSLFFPKTGKEQG